MQQYVAEKQNLRSSYILVTRVKPPSNLKTCCVLKTCTTVTLVNKPHNIITGARLLIQPTLPPLKMRRDCHPSIVTWNVTVWWEVEDFCRCVCIY